MLQAPLAAFADPCARVGHAQVVGLGVAFKAVRAVVFDGALAFHFLWAAPVEAIVINGLLISLAKDSGWIASGIVVVTVVALYAVSMVMTRIRGRFNIIQAKQVSLFFEVLQNMRPFRFYVCAPFDSPSDKV